MSFHIAHVNLETAAVRGMISEKRCLCYSDDGNWRVPSSCGFANCFRGTAHAKDGLLLETFCHFWSEQTGLFSGYLTLELANPGSSGVQR